MLNPNDIIEFWYTKPMSKNWFKSTHEIDSLILQKFELLWLDATIGKLDAWKISAQGTLALRASLLTHE